MTDATEPLPVDPVEPGATTIRRALLSVSDKTGIVDFARGLAELGVDLSRPAAPRRRCASRADGRARSRTSPASPR